MPICCAQAPCDHELSTLIPAITVSGSLNRVLLSCTWGICCEQTPEKAEGKNTRTTFLPRCSLRVNVLFPVARRVKSGAGSPTFRVLVWSGTAALLLASDWAVGAELQPSQKLEG